MTPAPAMRVGVGVSREKYREFLEEKRRRLHALCDAAKAYLCLETDQEIEELSKPEEAPDKRTFDPYGPWSPKVEDLAKASEAVQNLESQLEKLEDLGDDPHVRQFMGPIVDGMYRPMIQQQLDGAREHRDRIQKRMEEQAKKQEEAPQ